MKRVYLASQYARRDEMRELAKQLEENGYAISSRWLDEGFSLNMQLAELSPTDHQEIAEKDIEDVISSDVLIFFAEDQNNPPPRGGRHVEFGYALALGLEIYVVGERENIFHYLPNVRTVSDKDFLLDIL